MDSGSPAKIGPEDQAITARPSKGKQWLGLGLGASILRSLFASFSLSLFHYLVVPFFGLTLSWPELFIYYLGVALVSAALVGILLRNFPRLVVGKMLVFSLISSLFVAYAELISGRRLASDLFFPTTPSFSSISQGFMIFSILSIISSLLVRLLFKR